MAVVTCDAPSASRSCMTVESDMGSRAWVLDTTTEAAMTGLLDVDVEDDALHTVVLVVVVVEDDDSNRKARR